MAACSVPFLFRARRGTSVIFHHLQVISVTAVIMVPTDVSTLELQLLASSEPPPTNVRVVGGPRVTTYRAGVQRSQIGPLFELLELRALMLGDVDKLHLRDLDLRCPRG